MLVLTRKSQESVVVGGSANVDPFLKGFFQNISIRGTPTLMTRLMVRMPIKNPKKIRDMTLMLKNPKKIGDKSVMMLR